MMFSRRIESRGRSLLRHFVVWVSFHTVSPLALSRGLLIDREGGPPAPLPFTLISPGLLSMAWISKPAHQLVPCPARAAMGEGGDWGLLCHLDLSRLFVWNALWQGRPAKQKLLLLDGTEKPTCLARHV